MKMALKFCMKVLSLVVSVGPLQRVWPLEAALLAQNVLPGILTEGTGTGARLGTVWRNQSLQKGMLVIMPTR